MAKAISLRSKAQILCRLSASPQQAARRLSLSGDKVHARKDAHSNLLSKKETSSLYKIQFHNVKPDCLEAYENLEAEVQNKLHQDKDYPCEVVGSWTTWYGEQDQAVHLWRYRGGYPALTDCLVKLKNNKEYMEFRKERAKMLISRRNQLLLEFSFWNEPLPRPGPNIYELRSYHLKPGTMIEWGNHWARAIRHRQENNEAVGGFFSQIGHLYVVYHLWAYESLQSREETRNTAWLKEGWDVNVYNTGITHANPPVVFKTNRPHHHGFRRIVDVDLHTSYLKCYSSHRLPSRLNFPRCY
ncbi:hypothetical protein fugu_003573 [Takifugu bimaculatus]|uniref:NIPSNAP domain-containing protein n=1 Tax=Takifugu bimaculatus TaxID=433685 RepID=A0A4Z2BBT9_9TELE|nr:hypothetical protein fugu_003573 [Takifugu bimaculatus]